MHFPASGPSFTLAWGAVISSWSCCSATSGGVWQYEGSGLCALSLCWSPIAGPIVIVPSTTRTLGSTGAGSTAVSSCWTCDAARDTVRQRDSNVYTDTVSQRGSRLFRDTGRQQGSCCESEEGRRQHTPNRASNVRNVDNLPPSHARLRQMHSTE